MANEPRMLYLVVEYEWEDRIPHVVATTEAKAKQWMKDNDIDAMVERIEFIG